MTLWTAHELVEATGGVLSVPFDASGVSIDTRTLADGDLFVALLGEGRDGHAFVADALAKGAAGAMVHAEVAPAAPVLRVDDTQAADQHQHKNGQGHRRAFGANEFHAVGLNKKPEQLKAALV